MSYDQFPTPGAFTELDSFVNASASELKTLYQALAKHAREIDPTLHVFVNGPPDEGYVADQLDALFARYPDQSDRPLLFGVPVGIKDIFRIQDMPISCGSRLPSETFAGDEAACVTALRMAGAVILGRTVSTEFAYFEPGPTCNPHNPAHTPGGSSSGSAAGVASGLFPLSLGSQTVGSIIRPASYCGVVGFKPSKGYIPPQGIVNCSPVLDQVGFFCSSPELLDRVMPAWQPGWTKTEAPERIRLALPVGPYLDQAATYAVDWIRSTLAGLQATEALLETIEIPYFDDISEISDIHLRLMAGEMARQHSQWFAAYESLYAPRTAMLIREGQTVTQEELEMGQASCLALRSRLDAFMDEHGIDAIVSPSALGQADHGLASTGSPAMNLPWTHAGVPVVSLPLGVGPDALPLGMQLVGRFGADESLVGLVRFLWQKYRINGKKQ